MNLFSLGPTWRTTIFRKDLHHHQNFLFGFLNKVTFFASGCLSLVLQYQQRSSTGRRLFSHQQRMNCQRQQQRESRSIASPSVPPSCRGHAGEIFFIGFFLLQSSLFQASTCFSNQRHPWRQQCWHNWDFRLHEHEHSPPREHSQHSPGEHSRPDHRRRNRTALASKQDSASFSSHHHHDHGKDSGFHQHRDLLQTTLPHFLHRSLT